MALSKHLSEEIKAIKPISGNNAARWEQYNKNEKRLAPDAIKEALDELHRELANHLKL